MALAGCNQIAAERDGSADGADPAASLLERAEGGDVDAQLAAGRFYKDNAPDAEGAERARRESEALRWLTLAAEAENPEAASDLGIVLATADGTNRNLKEARRWLGRAGQAGQAPAYFMLGEISQSGEDAPPNPVMAAEFWRKAADLGHVGALHRLGEAHTDKHGTAPPADIDTAHFHAFVHIKFKRAGAVGKTSIHAVHRSSFRSRSSATSTRAATGSSSATTKRCAGAAWRRSRAIPTAATTWPSSISRGSASSRASTKRFAGTASPPSTIIRARRTCSGRST
jgi:hypothetical protein